MGIRDRHPKMQAMKDAFVEDTIKGVLRLGLGDRPETYLGDLQAAYKKWSVSVPVGWRYVVENWCDKLFGSTSRETFDFFVNSSVEEFEARIRCKLQAIEEEEPEDEDWVLDECHTLLVLDQERQQTIKDSLKSRRLDQRLYYMNIDSAQVWNDLINVGDYQQY